MLTPPPVSQTNIWKDEAALPDASWSLNIDLNLCYDDSPLFRHRLDDSEKTINETIESSGRSFLKQLQKLLELSKEFGAQMDRVADEIIRMGEVEKESGETPAADAFQTFGTSMKNVELIRDRTKVSSEIAEKVDRLIKLDIGDLKESRKKFDRLSDDYDATLAKCLSKKSKDPGIYEAGPEAVAIRKSFYETSLDYAVKLNETNGLKKQEFLENLLSMYFAYYDLYKNAWDQFQSVLPVMVDFKDRIEQAKSRCLVQSKEDNETRAKLVETHITADQNLGKAGSIDPPNAVLPAIPSRKYQKAKKEGYLFKRSSSRMVNNWTRRFFLINGDLLLYYKRGKKCPAVIAANLRLCSIRKSDAFDRRFCFEIMSPLRTYVLQAESELDMTEWIAALQQAINNSTTSEGQSPLGEEYGLSRFRERLSISSMSPSPLIRESVDEDDPARLLRLIPGNETCADCSGEDPQWASINMGTIICIECSGIHRGLGVHISKIKSLELDRWEPMLVQVMLCLGNTKANAILEYAYENLGSPDTISNLPPKICPDSSRAEKETFIITKYADREFIHRGLPADCATVDIAFQEATKEGNLVFMLKYLLQGANINWRNPANHLQSALHGAVAADLHVTVEYLLMWSADCLVVDEHHLTPVHYALRQNQPQMSDSLVRRALRDHPDLNLHELVRSANLNVSDRDTSSIMGILDSEKLMGSPGTRLFSNHSCSCELSPAKGFELDGKELPPLPEHISCSSGSLVRDPHIPGFDLSDSPELPETTDSTST